MAAAGCPRDRNRSSPPNASTASVDLRDVRCVERPEGCVWCEGRGPTPPLVEPDAVPASLCDPEGPGNCVDFCTRLAPECAVAWRTVPSCLLPSEQEFRRELFRRDTADRPEALVQGRVTDEAGRRIEGAKIRVWFQGTAIAEEVSGKDGSFRLRLRTGPWTYSVRVSRAGAGDRDRRPAHREAGDDRAQLPARPREHHPRARGQRKGEPIAGATVHAVRNAGRSGRLRRGAERPRTARSRSAGSTRKRYFLRASKFGWLPETSNGRSPRPAKRRRASSSRARA